MCTRLLLLSPLSPDDDHRVHGTMSAQWSIGLLLSPAMAAASMTPCRPEAACGMDKDVTSICTTLSQL